MLLTLSVATLLASSALAGAAPLTTQWLGYHGGACQRASKTEFLESQVKPDSGTGQSTSFDTLVHL